MSHEEGDVGEVGSRIVGMQGAGVLLRQPNVWRIFLIQVGCLLMKWRYWPFIMG